MEKYTHFSEQRLREIERKIERLIKESNRKIRDPRYIFLDNTEFRELLNIGLSTARNWREQNKITYSMINHKLYYRLSDIEKMIDDHRQS